MKFELKERYWRVPDKDLINNVNAVSEKLGKGTVTIQEYSEHGIYHCNTLLMRFGSWFAVLKKAGLKPRKAPSTSDKELLFKNLAAVWRRLGKQPTMEDMNDPSLQSEYSPCTYSYRFGTWMNALRKFIEYKKSKPTGKGKIRKRRKALRKCARGKGKKVHKTTRHIPAALRYRVLVRDRFKCTACGRNPSTGPKVKLHCDHIRAWSRGGETIFNNLQTLCEECNLGKGNK